MQKFFIRLIISIIAIMVITSGILPGVRVEGGTMTLVGIGILFGLLNMFVKPIVKLLTCPLILLSLGLFVFVLNALMLMLVAALSDPLNNMLGGRLVIDNFLWAMVGAFIVSLVSMVLEWLLGQRQNEQKVRTVTEVRYVVEKQKPQLDRDFDQIVGNPPQGFRSVRGDDDFDAP